MFEQSENGMDRVCEIPVELVRSWTDPLAHPPWHGVKGPITRGEIDLAISQGRLQADPVGPGETIFEMARTMAPEDIDAFARELHVERIAYLVVFPAPDAIVLDFGVPELRHVRETPELLDGHHRLAASIIRRDATIQAALTGSLHEARKHLGLADDDEAQELERGLTW